MAVDATMIRGSTNASACRLAYLPASPQLVLDLRSTYSSGRVRTQRTLMPHLAHRLGCDRWPSRAARDRWARGGRGRQRIGADLAEPGTGRPNLVDGCS